jgi:hypothetical protein
VIADRIYPQNEWKRVAGLFCHAQQNRLTVLERPKAMGIGPTWSALVQVTARVALDCAGGLRVERSRATDVASSETAGYAGRAVRTSKPSGRGAFTGGGPLSVA